MTLSTSEPMIVARRTAMMLLDFQPAILAQVPDRDALIDRAQIALGWARAHGVKLVFVRVAFAPDDYDAIPNHHKAFNAVKQNRLLPTGIHPSTSTPPWKYATPTSSSARPVSAPSAPPTSTPSSAMSRSTHW
ncbi:MAG: hypothetical protein QOE48_4601 [Mycobacterium sp.]|jgi:nicotinamidase-related amidase|nr:hypothetical protein [Mycobacterium sp.]